MARDRSDDPLLDANDVVRWVALSLAPALVLVVGVAVDMPWWGLVLAAIALGLSMRPLHRRYVDSAERRRPSRHGSIGT